MKPKKKKSNPIWDDVINELKELGQILKAGGLPAVEKKFRVTRLNVGKLPKPAKSINPKQVKGVRAKVGVSQPVFAALLGVSPQTVKAWEQGTKQPTSSARRLLSEINFDPDYWIRRMGSLCES